MYPKISQNGMYVTYLKAEQTKSHYKIHLTKCKFSSSSACQS